MSIIVLTPKPPQAAAAEVHTDESLSTRLASDFLNLLGHEGRRFDSFEQLRDYAQAQIDAASLAAKVAEPVAAAPAAATAEPVFVQPVEEVVVPAPAAELAAAPAAEPTPAAVEADRPAETGAAPQV